MNPTLSRYSWCVTALLLACSSEPPALPAGAAGNGNASGGQTGGGADGAGNAVGGSVGAASAGGGGGGALGTAGAAGNVAVGGDGGVPIAGGVGGAGGAGGSVSGAAGMAGAGGSAGSAQGGSNNIPAGYTGKPFGGTPQAIPGKIEIEKYDTGGANVAFKADLGGAFDKCGFKREDALKLQCTQQQGSPQDKSLPGCGVEPAGQIYLGYIGAGNWYKYTVNVLEAGTYVISGHEGVAGNTQLQFTFTDAVKTGNINLPSTDKCSYEAYHVWETQQNLGEITLTPGQYVLTINVVSAAMNLDWFAFTKK